MSPPPPNLLRPPGSAIWVLLLLYTVHAEEYSIGDVPPPTPNPLLRPPGSASLFQTVPYTVP